MIGKTINNYVIERKLGDGGMGEVFYAKHNKVDREVAIKVLHSHLFSNENIHNRFKNEANALIKLTHPNIVKIFDYVEQDDFACLIMEYINGYTLDDYIAKFSGPLPSVKASYIICSILDAVQYAHDNNVYHRDIKPANIMISKEGNKVRIMDFGIAKLTDSKNFKTTHANTQLGTPFYMSPEQIKGLPYTRMSDIYSLGITLFEMVTGKCPYHQITSLFELQSKIVNEPLPHTTDYYPDVSLKIQNAIIKATEKTPELRFQSCNDFKLYLLDKEKINSISNTSKAPVVKQTKENGNWLVYFSSSFALIIVVVLVIYFFSSGTDQDSGSVVSKGIDSTAIVTSEIFKSVDSIVNNTFSIQDSNSTMLNIYLQRKQKETNTKLSAKQIDVFNNETKTIKHLTTDSELCGNFDKYFSIKQSPTDALKTAVKVKLPTDEQILEDFWTKINKISFIKRIQFEKSSQISSISISKPKPKLNSMENEITIFVRFTITSLDDNSDSENASETLIYSRSGNNYLFSR